nr:MAG: hypothetical protein [Joensuu sobemovirus]UYL94361.1 MAG: hypothetical protein [Joensuu sobemovirus]
MVILTAIVPDFVKICFPAPVVVPSFMDQVKSVCTETARAVGPAVGKLVWRVMVREAEYLTLGGDGVVVHRPNWQGLGAIATLAGGYYAYRKLAEFQPPAKEGEKEEYEITQDPLKCNPESLVPGSTMFTGSLERLPKCQARIAVKRGAEYMVIGGGIRIDDYLVAPAHNFHPYGDLWVFGKNGVKAQITGEIHDIAPDVSAVRLTDWSLLGISQAKLGPLARASTASVMSSVDYRFSTGSAVPMDNLMGRMRYGATTAPGFSGSAYMSGPMCIGMHVHGGSYNGGYQSLYLYCRLKHIIATEELEVMVPERRELPNEGSDALAEEEELYEFEEVGTSRQGNRMAVARGRNGRFVYARADAVERIQDLRRRQRENPDNWPTGHSWADELEEMDIQDAIRRGELRPEALVGPNGMRHPGEDQPPAAQGGPGPAPSNAPQASSSQTGGQQPPSIKRQRLMDKLHNISSVQLALFLRLQERGQRLRSGMLQPTPAPRLSGNPS